MKKLKFSPEELSVLIPAINKRIDYCRNDDWLKSLKKQQRRLTWLETFIHEVESGEAYVRPITRATIQGIIQEHLLNHTNEKRIRFIRYGIRNFEINDAQKIDLYNTIFNKVVPHGTTKKRLIINS